jgi:hypothetical protein
MRQFRSDPATVPTIRMDGAENRVDPDKWRPLIMSFCRFYGLGERVWDSTLSLISESAYRPVPHMSRENQLGRS